MWEHQQLIAKRRIAAVFVAIATLFFLSCSRDGQSIEKTEESPGGSAGVGLPADSALGELTVDEQEQLCAWIAAISVEKEAEKRENAKSSDATVEEDSGLMDNGRRTRDGGAEDSGTGMTDRGVEGGGEEEFDSTAIESVEQAREKQKKAIYDDCMASKMTSACEVSEVEACFESGDSESAACKRFFECTESTAIPTNACTDWMCADYVDEYECVLVWGHCGRGAGQCQEPYWVKVGPGGSSQHCFTCEWFWDDEDRATGTMVELRTVRCYEWFEGCKIVSSESYIDVLNRCKGGVYPKKFNDGYNCYMRDMRAKLVEDDHPVEHEPTRGYGCHPDNSF